MKKNVDIQSELVVWIRKSQWCKFYPYEVVIPDNDQFDVEIRIPFGLSGSQLVELGVYLEAKKLCWLLKVGDCKELIVDIWHEPDDMIF